MLKFASIVTALGMAGFVMSSFIGMNAVSDVLFNVATVMIVAGPVVFAATVCLGLCVEFIEANWAAAARRAPGPMRDVRAAAVWPAAFYDELPEGLRRERKGPLSRSSGRAGAI